MHVLYATDGSEGALAGARLLSQLSLTKQDAIQVLAVHSYDEDGQRGQAAIKAATDALEGTQARVSTALRRGDAAEEIVQSILWTAAESEGYDALPEQVSANLIVVGSRGRSPIVRFLLGSVADKVARYAPCPTLLARPVQDGALDRVIVGVDGSEGSRRAVEYVARLPLPPDCRIRLMTVLAPTNSLSKAHLPADFVTQMSELVKAERAEAAERLTDLARIFGPERTVETAIVHGDAATVLMEQASAWHADLLAVSARGMSGLERFLLGSVSEKVLRHACCSVLIVRNPEDPIPSDGDREELEAVPKTSEAL